MQSGSPADDVQGGRLKDRLKEQGENRYALRSEQRPGLGDDMSLTANSVDLPGGDNLDPTPGAEGTGVGGPLGGPLIECVAAPPHAEGAAVEPQGSGSVQSPKHPTNGGAGTEGQETPLKTDKVSAVEVPAAQTGADSHVGSLSAESEDAMRFISRLYNTHVQNLDGGNAIPENREADLRSALDMWEGRQEPAINPLTFPTQSLVNPEGQRQAVQQRPTLMTRETGQEGAARARLLGEERVGNPSPGPELVRRGDQVGAGYLWSPTPMRKTTWVMYLSHRITIR